MNSQACQEKRQTISTEITNCVKILSVETNDKIQFEKWLDGVLADKRWTRNQLADNARLASGTLTNIFSGNKGVGKDVCKKIAFALDIPEEIVFRKAGLLKNNDDYDDVVKTIAHRVKKMDEVDKSHVLDYVDMLLRRRERFSLIDEFVARLSEIPRDQAAKIEKELKDYFSGK